MSAADTPDNIRAVINGQKVLASTPGATTVVTVDIPPGTQALWMVTTAVTSNVPYLIGLQSLASYSAWKLEDPSRPFPPLYIYVAFPIPAIDTQVEVDWTVDPAAEWFVIADTGGRLTHDPAMMASTGQPNSNNPLRAMQVAGTDGVIMRTLKTDATGALVTTGGAFPPVYAVPGAAAPADALQVGGSDGVNLRAFKTDATGQQLTIDQTLKLAIGVLAAALPADAVLIGGSDGANLRPVLLDANGRPLTIDQNLKLTIGATAAAVPADAVQMGGSDGANLRALLTDATGKLLTLDQNLKLAIAALAAAIPADAVQVGGSDGVNLRAMRVNQTGVPYSIPTVPNTAAGDRPPLELQWATAAVTAMTSTVVAAPGAGKRLRLFYIETWSQTSNATYALAVTDTAGNAINFGVSVSPAGATPPPSALPLTGFLCGTNTAVSLIVTAGTGAATVGYTIETV